MPALKKLRRLILLGGILLVGICAFWIYCNRPTRSDMAVWAPADSLAFLEINDLAGVTFGVGETQAWRLLSEPMGAPSRLAPGRFWILLARWTGIGSADALILARSQAAVIFSGAEGAQTGSTLTIKPLTTLIIETHTSQRRMRPAIE